MQAHCTEFLVLNILFVCYMVFVVLGSIASFVGLLFCFSFFAVVVVRRRVQYRPHDCALCTILAFLFLIKLFLVQ